MGYDNGSFSLFNQAALTSTSTLYVESLTPKFIPTGGAQFTNVYGSYINPSILSTATASVRNASGLSLNFNASASNMSILNFYSLYVAGPTLTSGTCGWMYGLYVTQPTTSGSGVIPNSSTAYIQGQTGIGVSVPNNYLEVGNNAFNSGMAVGTYAGAVAAPQNGVIVSRAVGIGTPSPVYPLDVQGGASAFQVLAPQTTVNAQLSALSQGYSQGGFGGGVVGSQCIMNKTTAEFFSTQPFSMTFGGLQRGVFDGRYIYTSNFGNLLRYDTSAPFSISLSYSFFNINTGLPSYLGAAGMAFDGRYIYLVSSDTGGSFATYDTTLPYNASSSYQAFRPPGSGTFYFGAVFDGTYIYYTPYKTSTNISSGVLLRYNTNLPFNLTSSYSTFDTKTNLNSLCSGYLTGTFDGRYVYFPSFYIAPSSVSGYLVQYDTSASFTSTSSYQFFNIQNLNTLAGGFGSATFDGRFVYMGGAFTSSGVNNPGVTRYDTYMPLTNSLSYTIFNTNVLNSVTSLYLGQVFDGRYVYFASEFTQTNGNSGVIVSYDTTSPFNQSTSYFVFDTTTVNSLCTNPQGAAFDGQYVYIFGSAVSGAACMITRFPGYTGGFVSAPVIGYSTGLTVSGFIDFLMPTSITATAGTVGASPSTAAGFLSVYVNGNQKLIPYF